MILSAATIRRLCLGSNMLTPFSERGVFDGRSFGLSVAGYDIRIAEKVTLYSRGFGLASSMERFCMPKNIIGFVKDKSSWARLGISVFNTVIEPGWEGFLTLEVVNHGDGINIPPGSPIAQIIFQFTDELTTGYTGKYQNQEPGPQSARYE